MGNPTTTIPNPPGSTSPAEARGRSTARTTIAWSANPSRGNTGSNPRTDIDALAAALEPEALAGLGSAAASLRTDAWEELVRARGLTPARALPSILPPIPWVQARLVTKADEAELRTDSRAGGAYGAAYKTVLSKLSLARDSAQGMEAVLRSIWLSEPGVKLLASAPVSVLAASDRRIPAASDLDAAHRYALDVFFTEVKRQGPSEIGPPIRSMTRGIVVAAADDWEGGDKAASYRRGGLSPKAGNGVIVYCPDDGRYYSYFHLHSLKVSPGDFVGSGTVLGLGGNTGVNARRKGHGAHVHLEIHDRDGRAWPSLAIREHILRLR